jgi:hypothetical protein
VLARGVLEDVVKSAEDAAAALGALGYDADFSFESLMELERFMADNVLPKGGAKPGSQLNGSFGGKLFMLGSYLGEVIRRKVNGAWRVDESDPDSTINVRVLSESGWAIWPMQKMIGRFSNGDEDNVWAYAQVVVSSETP